MIEQEQDMNTTGHKPIAGLIALGATLAVFAGGANAMDRETRNTLIGAAIGAVGGALLTQGDPVAMIGGAAVGGLVGNVTTDRRHDYRADRGGWNDGRGYYRGGDRRNWNDGRGYRVDQREWHDQRWQQQRYYDARRVDYDRYNGYRGWQPAQQYNDPYRW
jgi:osmotically inducible lipoprotein OsmB